MVALDVVAGNTLKMRVSILTAVVLLLASGVGHASPQTDAAWEYLTRSDNTEQWAVISVDGNPGYFQCARYPSYLRCPFPVWIKLLPGTRIYASVSSRDAPYPEVEGTETRTFMDSDQVDALVKLLSREGLRFAKLYSRLENEKGADAGTSFEVVLVLELDYDNFGALVAEMLQTVRGADTTSGYRVDTDRD